MDARTEKALRESIVKWEKNAAVEELNDARTGVGDCPLCAIFWQTHDTRCKGCPVFNVTGLRACRGTPYDGLGRASDTLAGFRETAQREVDFLKSLLPEAKSS